MINKVILAGRLARAPKSNQPNSKQMMCATFPIAIERGYKPKDEQGQVVDYLYCKAFNKTASNIMEYCRKGSAVCITGQIHSNRYTKDGKDKPQYFTEIIIENIKFLPNFGIVKTGDVLPQTPDEIWNELSEAEKAHALMITKESVVRQFIGDQKLNTEPLNQPKSSVISDEESARFISKLEEVVVIDKEQETDHKEQDSAMNHSAESDETNTQNEQLISH